MNEWSLLLFTLALQIAAGGVLALALAGRFGSGTIRLGEWGFFTAIALAGSLFSLTHLGDMFGAYRALLHVSTSWLSREAWLTGIFIGLLVLYGYLVWKGKPRPVLAYLAALVGLCLVFASARVYAGTVMEKWTASCPYADFFVAALLIGPFLAGFWRKGNEADMRIVRILFSLGAVLFVLNIGFFGGTVRDGIAILRYTLTGLGLVAGFRVLFAPSSSWFPACVAALLLVLGEGMGRYMFFMV